MMEIGLGIQGDKPLGAYRRLAAAAEAGGIDVISVYGDLMYQPPIGPLLEIASATSRVRLGPACLNPYSMHPYEIAGQIALVDLASHGRAYLGLARGSWLATVGIDQPSPVATLRDAAAIVERLLAHDRAGYAGSVFSLARGAELAYETHRSRVPLLIGSWGPKTLALAGEIADEVKIGGSANPEMVAIARSRVANSDVGIVIGAVSVVDTDGAAARALARREVAMYLDVVAQLDPTIHVDPEVLAGIRGAVARRDLDSAAGLIDDRLLDRFAFAGTPEQVADQASALAASGAARIEFGTPHGIDSLTGVDLIAREVIGRIER